MEKESFTSQWLRELEQSKLDPERAMTRHTRPVCVFVLTSKDVNLFMAVPLFVIVLSVIRPTCSN